MAKFGFIIDTNKYSGNFEREMCAYITGHIGECGVGGEELGEYTKSGLEPLDHVQEVADEHGDFRPVSIYPTPNIWNNGLGFHFKDGEEELALAKWIESMVNHKTTYMNNYKKYYDNLPKGWTVKQLDKVIADHQREIDEAKMKTEVGKYPAYQSIIIYFYEKPSEVTIEFMKQRAYDFLANGKEKGLEIFGFRLMEVTNTFVSV